MGENSYEQFKNDFWASVATVGAGDAESFLTAFSEALRRIEALDLDIIPSYLSTKGLRQRSIKLNGYIENEDEKVLSLFIVDEAWQREPNEEANLTQTDLQTFVRQLIAFLLECRDKNGFKRRANEFDQTLAAWGLIEDLLYGTPLVFSEINLYVLTSRDAEAGRKTFNVSVESIENIPVNYQVWDLHKLYEIELSRLGRQAVTVNFPEEYDCEGLPCIEAPSREVGIRNYLGIIPGRVLADLFDKYSSRLLERNVRSFLSFRGGVNREIRKTITNHPTQFFTLNNGIAVTVLNPVFRGTVLVGAEDFQIVNGGQSTAALAEARRKSNVSLEEVFVPMKLTVIDEDNEEIDRLIMDISRASNSQNKVNDADFFSIHPFHRKIEEISAQCLTPPTENTTGGTTWFYERTRGQYEQLLNRKSGKRAQAEFMRKHPKQQVISKTDLAKFRNTWEGLPHIVSKGAGTNFKAFSSDMLEMIKKQWKDADPWAVTPDCCNERYYKETVGIAILFRALEKGISNAPWYRHSYRANLVTYAIAFFAMQMQQERDEYHEFDLTQVWKVQCAPPPLLDDLLNIAKGVQSCLLECEWPQQNITQVCKQEQTWKAIRKLLVQRMDEGAITLHFEHYKELFSDTKNDKQQAKISGKLRAETDVLTQIIQLGKEYWIKLDDFVETSSIYPTSFVKVALRQVKRDGYVTNSKYAQELLKLRERALGEGFPETL